jgi:membrane protease subunit HflK
MSNQFGGGRPPDIGEVMAQVSERMSRNLRRLGPVVGMLLLLFLAATGFYQVEPGELGVVRTLGKETGRTDPGLHFRVPLVQRVDIVNVEEIRRIEVGFRGDQVKSNEAQMLTGDENIVEAQMIVQYRVADPSAYLFRLSQPEETLRATAEVVLRSVVGRMTIDDVITRGRGQVQSEALEQLQRLMNTYQSGLAITEVKLQSVDPPDPVKDAFHDVVRAREEKEKLINQARGYQEDVIPRARGEAEQMLRAAEAYKEQRVLEATGDAKRFDAVYQEYRKAERVTRRRLHLESMQRVLNKVDRKTVIERDLAGSTLPVLPLQQSPAVKAVAATNAATAPGDAQ